MFRIADDFISNSEPGLILASLMNFAMISLLLLSSFVRNSYLLGFSSQVLLSFLYFNAASRLDDADIAA